MIRRRAWGILLLLALLLTPAALAGDTQRIRFTLDEMEIATVSGTSIDYNAYDAGDVIAQIEIDAPAGSEVSILLYDSGQTISANATVADNLETSAAIGNYTLTSGGAINPWSYPIGQDFSGFTRRLHFDYLTSSIYAEDPASETVSLRYQTWSSAAGTVIGSAAVPLNNIIYRVSITSDLPVEVRIWHAPADQVYGQISDQQQRAGNFLSLLWGALNNLYWILYLGYTVFTKIFIQNFTLVFTLYEVSIAAVSYGQSRDIWTAHKKFIRYNVALFEFIYKAIVGFLNIINGALLRL